MAARGHRCRQALGQLLDYVNHAPDHVDTLTALFPKRSTSSDVQLLHRYGMDVVHLDASGGFKRVQAPPSSVQDEGRVELNYLSPWLRPPSIPGDI